MKKKPPIDWARVERICRASFTGTRLTEEEMQVLQDAHQQDPDQYRDRTRAIRDEERHYLKSL